MFTQWHQRWTGSQHFLVQQMPLPTPLNETALSCSAQQTRPHLAGLSMEQHLASSGQEFLMWFHRIFVRIKKIKRCSRVTQSVKLNLLRVQFHAASFCFCETKHDEGSHCGKFKLRWIHVSSSFVCTVPPSPEGKQLDKGDRRVQHLCVQGHRVDVYLVTSSRLRVEQVAGLHSLTLVSPHLTLSHIIHGVQLQVATFSPEVALTREIDPNRSSSYSCWL